MLKKSLKAFFSNMNAIIYVMAFVYFGATIFFSLVILGASNSFTQFAIDIKTLLQDQSITLKVEVNDLLKLLQQENSIDNFKAMLQDFVSSLSIQGQSAIEQATNIINNAVNTFTIYVAIGLIILIIGYFIGSFLCGREIKIKQHVKRGILVALVGKFLGSVIFGGLLVIATYLLNLFPWSAAISGVVIALLQAFFALWRAAILQNGRKGALKNVKFKDVLSYVTINIILYVIGFGLAYLLILLSGSVTLGIVIALPLLVYTNKFLDSYACIYVVKKEEIASTANPS